YLVLYSLGRCCAVLRIRRGKPQPNQIPPPPSGNSQSSKKEGAQEPSIFGRRSRATTRTLRPPSRLDSSCGAHIAKPFLPGDATPGPPATRSALPAVPLTAAAPGESLSFPPRRR
ncbi:uncharacterized protein Tco025E_09594, partial [Trypanosoma conorhini]